GDALEGAGALRNDDAGRVSRIRLPGAPAGSGRGAAGSFGGVHGFDEGVVAGGARGARGRLHGWLLSDGVRRADQGGWVERAWNLLLRAVAAETFSNHGDQ